MNNLYDRNVIYIYNDVINESIITKPMLNFLSIINLDMRQNAFIPCIYVWL